MSATVVGEWWEGRDGEDQIDTAQAITRYYMVRTDNQGDDSMIVLGAAGLPLIRDGHPNNAGASVRGRYASQMSESPFLWIVRIEYSSNAENEIPEQQTFDPETGESSPLPSGGGGGGGREQDPTKRSPVLTISQQQVKKIARFARELKVYDSVRTISDSTATPATLPPAIERWLDGTIEITNSAADPFDPPAEAEVMRDVITIEDYVSQLSLASEKLLENAVNVTPWMGYGARTLKCISNERTQTTENNFKVWHRRRSFAHDPDTWDIQLPDVGYREHFPGEPPSQGDPEGFPGYPARWQVITDETLGRPIQPPGVQLDGKGRILDPASGTTVYMRYRYFPEIEFRDLYNWIPANG